MSKTFTAIVKKEDDWFVAECPEVGTFSQGRTVDEAVSNLKEATELFLEDCSEIAPQAIVTDFEAACA